MRVSSPVGELPFTIERVSWDRGLRVEGKLGTWRAHVQLEFGDLGQLARLPTFRAGGVVAGALLIALMLRRNGQPST